MLEKPISSLRQRMIDDMTARRFKEKVQKEYIQHVRTFAAFLGRSPDTATSEDLRLSAAHGPATDQRRVHQRRRRRAAAFSST
jgi:integrase/recombinase XerD